MFLFFFFFLGGGGGGGGGEFSALMKRKLDDILSLLPGNTSDKIRQNDHISVSLLVHMNESYGSNTYNLTR